MKIFYIKRFLSELINLLKFINKFFVFITLVFYSGYIIISNTNIMIDGLPFDPTSYLNLIGLVFSSFILMMTIINVYKTLDYAMTNDLLFTHIFSFLLEIAKYIVYLILLTHTETTLFLAKILQNPSLIYELIFIVIIITITTAILNFINNKIDLYPKLIDLNPEILKVKLKQKENIFKNQFSKTLKLIDFKIISEETPIYKKEIIQLFIRNSAFVFLPELYISVETSNIIKENIKNRNLP